jgi:TonB-linked SusC/RagA family outer membrane protein
MMKRYIFNLLLVLGVYAFLYAPVQAQGSENTVQIRGTVLDEAGNPVSSAKIFYGGGAKLAFTGADGSYTLNMLMADIAVIEADGYETVRIDGVSLKAASEVKMVKRPFGLKSSDLIDVPFGTLYGRQMVGAVTVIDPNKTMQFDRTQNVKNVVNGRVPGMFGTEDLRTNNDIYEGTLNEGGNMVTVIDGVPRTGYNLNLSEIESVTVLKDITTRALYGAQALDGVILITTKRGEANKRGMNFTVEQGISDPISYPEFLDAADYMTYYNQALVNDGLPEKYTSEQIAETRAGTDNVKYPDEDYYNSTYLKKMGTFTNVIGEASGGNSNARYYVNMGWKNNSRLLKKVWEESYNDGVNTFNIRGNVDYKINNFISMKIDGIAFYETDNTPRFTGTNQSFYTLASTLHPDYYPVLIDTALLSPDQQLAAKVINGRYVPGGTSEYRTNIYGDMAVNGYYTTMTRILQNNTSLDFDLNTLVKGLSAKAYLTFDMNNNYVKSLARTYAVYQPVYTTVGEDEILSFAKYGVDKPAENPQVSNVGFYRRISLAGQANFVRDFNEIHKLNITGISYIDFQTVSGQLQDDKSATLGVRANYMLKDRYIAEVNVVASGSAKLDENKWGTSPSFGLAWVVSEEGFLKGSSLINYLKIRANAGILKTDQYSDYRQYMNYYTSGSLYYYNFATWSNNPRNVNAGNPGITWSEKQELSIGFESLLFKDKLSLEATYFSNKLSGIPLLLNNIYPGYVENAWQNYGEYTDEGIEWGLRYNMHLGKVVVTLGHTAVYSSPVRVKDNVLDYAESWRKRTNVASDAMFGLEADGFYDVTDFNPDGSLVDGLPLPVFGQVKPGDIKYLDFNDDGFIDQKDEKILGNTTSRFQYGLDLNVRAGNFEVYVLGTGQTGAEKIYSSSYDWVYGDRKYSEIVRNAWTEGNASTADYPRLSTKNSPNNFQNSTFWMRNDLFFTLHTAQLTYNMPYKQDGSGVMKSMQLYIRGTNLLTFSENKERRELNVSSQPQMRYYSIGINAAF